MEDLKRAKDASEIYLEAKGFEPIGEIDGFSVYYDNDDLVFVKIRFVDKSEELSDIDELDDIDELFGKPQLDRKKFETAMVKWLVRNPEDGNHVVRYDEVAILYLGGNRAIMRHGVGISRTGEEE